MNILEATDRFEGWLSRQTPTWKEDLKRKHEHMGKDVCSFLRATYFRWAQVWPVACPDCANAPVVLAVGDLQVESFGTWRDADARLVWGVNDFDECYPLPYTNDLIRLAASAHLAINARQLALPAKEASAKILEGYQRGLKERGRPFVLADQETPLRAMVRERLEAPEKFWKKFWRKSVPLKKPVPPEVMSSLKLLLANRNVPLKFYHRKAGLGHCGKPRFTAVGEWAGGGIAREAKAVTPSASVWASGSKTNGVAYYERILERAVRAPDPMVVVRGPWVVRRLSPDCFRLKLDDLPKKRDESELLFSMGWETANIHLGTNKSAEIARDLKRRGRGWLHRAAKIMRAEVEADYKEWCKSH